MSRDAKPKGEVLYRAVAEVQHEESIKTQRRYCARTWPGCNARVYRRAVKAGGVRIPLLVLVARARPVEEVPDGQA